MDNHSQNMLRRVEANDVECTGLWIGHPDFHDGFISSDASDYSRLGAAIGNNTYLEELVVALDDEDSLDAANNEFFDGLKRNSSISDLELHCNGHILVGGVEHEILKSHQKINNNLTYLRINSAVLDNGGGDAIIETLRWCTIIKTINFGYNNITDEQLLPIVEAIKRGCKTSLESLFLHGNSVSNASALATLLADPNSNLQFLNLNTNQIGNEGATVIANSLANNIKLKTLCLRRNPFDQSAVGIFCTVLCNTSSVNTTYCSNHTLDTLRLSDEQEGQHADHLSSIMRLNNGTNTSHVAIEKILKYHPDIDMEPLFEWDAEGEQTLKALPHVIDWFGRAEEAVAGDQDRGDYQIEKKKLSAIFQFTKAMPLFFVQPFYIDEGSKKRKRDLPGFRLPIEHILIIRRLLLLPKLPMMHWLPSGSKVYNLGSVDFP